MYAGEDPAEAVVADGPYARHAMPAEEQYRLLERPEIVVGPAVKRAALRVFGPGGIFLLVVDRLSGTGVAFRDAEALLGSGNLESRHPFLLFRHAGVGCTSVFLWNTVGGLVAETHEGGSEGAAALVDVMSCALRRHGAPLAGPAGQTAVRTDSLHPRASEAASAVQAIFSDIQIAMLEADRVIPGPEPDGGCYLPDEDDGLHHLCLAAWRRLGGRAGGSAAVVPVVVGPRVLTMPREDFLRMVLDAAAFAAATAVGEPAAPLIDFAPGPPLGRGPAFAVVCALTRGFHGDGVCDGLGRLYDLPADAPELVWWQAALPGVHLAALQDEIDAACAEEADCLRFPVGNAELAVAVGRASVRVLEEVLRPRARSIGSRQGETGGSTSGLKH
jgi:hypothetical protein